MKRSQQILHILQKDMRQRWPEIASVLALIVLLTIVSVDNPTTQSVRLNAFLRSNDIIPLVYVLLPIAWCLLIARAIHGESLPGREQLWLTRPYNRLSLVLAKLVLILLFVHLPLIVAHAIVLNLSDLPYPGGAMAIGHLVLFAVLTLPAMTVASLTRSLGQFIAVAVGVFVGVIAAIYIQLEVLPNIFGFGGFFQQGSSWAAMALLYLFVAVCAAAACAWQYRNRRTRAVAVTLASLGAVGILMLFIDVPKSLARAIELRLYGDDTPAPLITFGQPEVVQHDSSGLLTLRFPQIGVIGGLDAPVLHDWRFRLVSESGEQLERRSLGHDHQVEVFLSPEWVARFGDSPLQVQIDYVIETFEETVRQQVQVSHSGEPDAYSLIEGRLHCLFTAYDWRPLREGMLRSAPRMSCRSAFMSPGDWNFELVRTMDGLTGVITHERTELPIALDPIIEVSLPWWAEEDAVDELYDISMLPVVVRKRAALHRGQVQIGNIVLTDLIAGD